MVLVFKVKIQRYTIYKDQPRDERSETNSGARWTWLTQKPDEFGCKQLIDVEFASSHRPPLPKIRLFQRTWFGLLNQFASIPSSFLANLHVFRDTVFVTKTIIGPHDGFAIEWLHQWMKVFIIHIYDCPIPSDNTANVIPQPTKLDADVLAALVTALFAHLLWTATCAYRKNQFNRITVHDREEGWFGHQQITSILMSFE